MKVLCLLGSRNPEGQTASAAQALLDGVMQQGYETEQVFLTECSIERCRQCDHNGWGLCRQEGQCVIDDDLAALIAKIRDADAVVFATPVYFGDLSESMRGFLDRMRRVCRHEEGKVGITGKPVIGICVAGGGGGGAPNCTVSLKAVLQHCGFNVVDMVPARRQNLAMKRDILPIVGAWLTTQVS
ncbi:MAG: flavodoxin family protein [Anaerolineae bacterium]|nr:flavodoxin family protein [Anaerolineae bacterium]